MNTIVACAGATQEGARCRKHVAQGHLCTDHSRLGGPISMAPVPDVVLFKANINMGWVQRFQKLGVPQKQRDQALEAKHAEHAQQFGRDAFRYRQVADSGVPVLGKEGGHNLDILQTLREIRESHDLIDMYFLPTRADKQDMRVLVCVCKMRDESATTVSKYEILFKQLNERIGQVWNLLTEFYDSTFEHVHLWANPPEEDGSVTHTVNASHRRPQEAPEAELHFGNVPGSWYVTNGNQ